MEFLTTLTASFDASIESRQRTDDRIIPPQLHKTIDLLLSRKCSLHQDAAKSRQSADSPIPSRRLIKHKLPLLNLGAPMHLEALKQQNFLKLPVPSQVFTEKP